MDKVNGQINAIHDDSLELTEFRGHLSPFDLNNLEAKVCKLAAGNKYKNDLLEPQDALQEHDSNSNSRSQNLEDLTGTGFDVNNCSPIPPVGKATSQQGVAILTLTPKPRVDADLNISDPTHIRGKINRVNSFTTSQEQTETTPRSSKGGPIKRSNTSGQALPSTSNHANTGRTQVCCTACRGRDHLRKDCREDVFCTKCRTRSHIIEMCCAPIKNR